MKCATRFCLLTVISNLMQHAGSSGHLTSGHAIQRWYQATIPHAPLTVVNTMHIAKPFCSPKIYAARNTRGEQGASHKTPTNRHTSNSPGHAVRMQAAPPLHCRTVAPTEPVLSQHEAAPGVRPPNTRYAKQHMGNRALPRKVLGTQSWADSQDHPRTDTDGMREQRPRHPHQHYHRQHV